jgi:hypothetical protein
MGPPADPPGGTPECPDDKNREGCRCDTIDEKVACWPGKRVNRNRGICEDGETTCLAYDEFGGRWGPCEGAILPVEGVRLGAEACRCFSEGTWALDNVSPCFVNGGTETYAVSTVLVCAGTDTSCTTDAECGGAAGSCVPDCPSLEAIGLSGETRSPRPPTVPWSANTLKVDCTGRFELCYTLKAGDVAAPSTSDCTIAQICTYEVWYAEVNAVQSLPALLGWITDDPSEQACAAQFVANGGYSELSVRGLSIECDPIDDGAGNFVVFQRNGFCPLDCDEPDRADDEDCQNCSRMGSGDF